MIRRNATPWDQHKAEGRRSMVWGSQETAGSSRAEGHETSELDMRHLVFDNIWPSCGTAAPHSCRQNPPRTTHTTLRACVPLNASFCRVTQCTLEAFPLVVEADCKQPQKLPKMDRQSVYTLSLFGESQTDNGDTTFKQTQKELVSFIMEFHLENVFIYRDQIRENVLSKQYYCDIDITHLIAFDEDLAHRLNNEPAEIIPIFESALKTCTQRILYPSRGEDDLRLAKALPEHQLLIHSSVAQTTIRGLTATSVSHLVRIPGIVIGASTLSSKATALHVQCRNCGFSMNMPITSGFSGVTLPRVCGRPRDAQDPSERCPLDPYFVVHEKSQFIDQQVLKLQEAPDDVPVGELPRHILVSADRYLANRVVPGSRCVIMGVFSIYNSQKNSKNSGAVAIRNPYLRAVGIQTDITHNSSSGMGMQFTEEEEQEFLELSRRPDLYSLFASCIAPSIYGNSDIKKAITCLLLGGSKKILPDGMRLRGDINVLLLGDPGTAKSQLLKFVEKCSPIAIYTSGKGSSAAGLTASVQRDTSTREFYLEGGAMVLADGGVVCIDEFDKMRDEDRVAIHEAMEQQTISIAKAGITTILNARTSVLAAANPIFGRYDDLKSPGENIDFQTTILSRFDLIFIVRDEHDRHRDETIAKHVMGIHMGGAGIQDAAHHAAEIPVEKMKRYLSYAKSRCAPRLSAEAAEKLSSHFVAIRRQVARAEADANQRSSIPITVRQLESLVRLTESLAKLELQPIATEAHVDEAIRLFLGSTMDAVLSAGGHGDTSHLGIAGNRDLVEEVHKVEDELRRRLPIGYNASLATLRREFVERKAYSEQALHRALQVLVRRESVQFRRGGTLVARTGVVGDEESSTAHGHGPIIHATAPSQLLAGLTILFHARPARLGEPTDTAEVLFALDATTAATLAARCGKIIQSWLSGRRDRGLFFRQVTHGALRTVARGTGTIAIASSSVRQMAAAVVAVTTTQARPTTTVPVMVSSGVLRCSIIITVPLVDLGRAESHGHAGPAHVARGVGAGFGGAVVADLAPYSTHHALTARARPPAEQFVVVAAGHFHGGSHLGGALSGEDPRIFVLGSITPDGGLLFPHQGNVRGGRGGGCATRGGGASGCGQAGHLLHAGVGAGGRGGRGCVGEGASSRGRIGLLSVGLGWRMLARHGGGSVGESGGCVVGHHIGAVVGSGFRWGAEKVGFMVNADMMERSGDGVMLMMMRETISRQKRDRVLYSLESYEISAGCDLNLGPGVLDSHSNPNPAWASPNTYSWRACEDKGIYRTAAWNHMRRKVAPPARRHHARIARLFSTWINNNDEPVYRAVVCLYRTLLGGLVVMMLGEPLLICFAHHKSPHDDGTQSCQLQEELQATRPRPDTSMDEDDRFSSHVKTDLLPLLATKRRSAKPCRLLALPAELRTMIWSFTLLSDGSVKIRTSYDFVLPALLRVCRSIRGEATKLYYHINAFEFAIHPWAVDLPKLWLRHIGSSMVVLVDELQIRFDWMSARKQLRNFSSEKYWGENIDRDEEARQNLAVFAKDLVSLGVDLDNVVVVMGGGVRESDVPFRPKWMRYFWRDMLASLCTVRDSLAYGKDPSITDDPALQNPSQMQLSMKQSLPFFET
nr:dna replication licensing factor mcm5 [Quercus suber]